ncbi:hypothetical protein BJ875DRAFT_524325 [Amylocarpus encephaloides]|uniref:Uncharacterized protein n=1 Tax=Amylocarpus encephaloides TaxID=45428 RepID=A0A9P8C7H0_9HELO|nr:hypothetical protein BJ875DRAFT_524325 [Amylocarpus encephaloides]
MLHISNTFWLVVWAAVARASTEADDPRATITIAPRASPVNLAVIPTKPGQIGVNPVEEDIGDPDIYRGTIQHAEQSTLITVDDSTTRWLAKHIDFLTETTTQGTTSTVQLSVATAAAAAGAVAVGDITVVLAEGLANKVAQAADAAVKACNAVNAKRDSTLLQHRAADDVLSCLLSKGADAYADGGLFSIVNPAEWEAIAIDAAANAVPLMKGAFQVAKTQARKAILAIFMSAVSINLSEAAAVGGAVLVGAIVLPKLGFGAPVKTDTSKCPSGAKKNSESANQDCQGNPDTELCSVDPNKGCPCLVVFTVDIQEIDDMFFDQQIDIIHSINAMPDPSPPKEIKNADTITVNAPTPSPTCGSNGKSAPSVSFDIKIPDGKDGISVKLPIADQPGSWSLGFDNTDSISFWQIDSGATKFVPITNGNGAPPNGKVEWTVPDGNPTTNTILTLFFNKGNLDLKATISGQQTCTAPANDPPPTGTPNSGQCISDCSAIVGQLEKDYGDQIDVTNSNDLSKMVDFATGTSNKADNDWWRISSHGNCFLMIGKDASHRGFPDPPPPAKRQDLIDFINDRKLYACINAHPMLVSTPPTLISNFAGFAQFCLTDFDNYQKCTGQVPSP